MDAWFLHEDDKGFLYLVRHDSEGLPVGWAVMVGHPVRGAYSADAAGLAEVGGTGQQLAVRLREMEMRTCGLVRAEWLRGVPAVASPAGVIGELGHAAARYVGGAS